MNLLHLDSSILAGGSVSRELTAAIVAAEKARHPNLTVTYRDLAATPADHLSGAHLAVFQGNPSEDAALLADVGLGGAMLEEFLAADIVVVGAPMYNFSVPSQLKTWIDRVAVAGKTFRYTANGPEGLAGGKKVIVASSRGGFYGADTPAASMEHQESYLKAVFAFFGITDVTFVRAEGLAVGPEQRAKALENAHAEVLKLAA
jgi:FMN-dependent NADH-azoreductase